MSRNVQIVIIAVLFLLCCCLALITLGVVYWSLVPQVPTPVPLVASTATPTPPGKTAVATPLDLSTATPVPLPTPTAGSTPLPSPTPQPVSATTTEARLLAAELPQRDIRLLAERLRKTGPIPAVVHETPPSYEIGDRHTFWVGNVDTMDQFQITAVLRYETPHLYMWVEDGLSYDQDALARSAETFESKTYPTNRAFFGDEWTPGVDNDPRLHVLHSTGQRMGSSVAGYYSSADEYSQLANPYSNEREMFYISLSGMRPGTSFYNGVLAHEFQHMIHWANDRNEETWLNEGCSELAAYLNGYDPGGFDWLFVADPDVQLTTWPEIGSAGPHYGGSYLFVAYFMGRFGEEVMQRVVAHPANGVAGFDAVLADQGLTFDDVFADWLVANYVDNLSVIGGEARERYAYPDHVVGPVTLDATHDTYPAQRASTVHQYAADYVELAGRGDLAIFFQGDTQARLVPAEAHSGRYAWWSNRGDDSDMMLTQRFDLRALNSATLQVWMWYDIEEDWDYAYVEISTDGGQTWDVLTGPSSTSSNPNGNSFGPAYTGRSNGWIEESFDLGAYAGREVLLRFEYVTDDAVNRPGWLIDDIRIPELGYEDDMESGAGEWQADGFVYSDNRVAQRYRVQVIATGRTLQVLPVSLDETQRGQIELRGLGGDVDLAVLVISAIAPVTTEVAAYEYMIQPIE
jgi:hypothetical protein